MLIGSLTADSEDDTEDSLRTVYVISPEICNEILFCHFVTKQFHVPGDFRDTVSPNKLGIGVFRGLAYLSYFKEQDYNWGMLHWPR